MRVGAWGGARSPVLVGERSDLRCRAGLLSAKLVAGESQDHEATRAQALVERLQLAIVRVRQASLRRDVHHERDLALILGERCVGVADELLRGEGIEVVAGAEAGAGVTDRGDTAGCEGGADAVVLDAPCSGSGTLRRNPEHRYRAADPASYKELCTLQAKLLDSASACVRVGGTLTYSVCSPTLAETDECIAAFLKRSPNFELVPAAENEVLTQFVADSPLLGEGACVRTWTHRHPADSHFAALLRRRE